MNDLFQEDDIELGPACKAIMLQKHDVLPLELHCHFQEAPLDEILTIYVYLTPSFMNPEPNPDRLGNSVSKIKTPLSKAAERSFDALWATLGCIIETLRP